MYAFAHQNVSFTSAQPQGVKVHYSMTMIFLILSGISTNFIYTWLFISFKLEFFSMALYQRAAKFVSLYNHKNIQKNFIQNMQLSHLR